MSTKGPSSHAASSNGSSGILVGKSVPRKDGADKVTGRAMYIDDYVTPNALYGGTVRSQIARGKLRGIIKDPSFDWSDVIIATAKDIPGDNVVYLIEDDQPLLADKMIHHMYEPVALVACADPHKLAKALAAITLDVEPLPPVLTIAEALGEMDRNPDHKVFKTYCMEHRLTGTDIQAEIAKCEVIVRGRYEVHHQEQLYIEPQGMIAWWDKDGVHITGSLQCPYYVHKAIKRAFALEGDNVHITQAVTGGGFGGKEEYPSILAAHAALLAHVAKRPVRMIYGRKEDIEATTKRHPARIDITTGLTKDGKLVALDVDCVMDGGAYATLTSVVLSRGILHAAGAYEWNYASIKGKAVQTHTPPNGAFRGFGAPQTIWAIERHMDKIAATLKMDGLALRRKNLLRIGAVTCTGQTLNESVGVEECIEKALASSDYEKKRQAYETAPIVVRADGARIKRGIGICVFMHGAGFTGSGERRLKGKVQVDLEPGGKLRIRTGSTDIGQGTETIFRQIAADAADLPFSSIEFEQPSTTNVPDSGPTVASRTVMVVGSIVGQAAKMVAGRVRAHAPLDSFAKAGDALLASSKEPVVALVQYEPPGNNQWNDDTYQGDAYPCYSWGCDIAELEVDVDTFETKIIGFWAAQDIGKAINPILCEGQVEGGTLQAIGWALYENVVWKDGRIMNPRMTNYVIPTSKDSPPFTTILVEHPFSGGPMGAKGVGELPMDGGAPAIASALSQALHAELPNLPLLPEDLFRATTPHAPI